MQERLSRVGWLVAVLLVGAGVGCGDTNLEAEPDESDTLGGETNEVTEQRGETMYTTFLEGTVKDSRGRPIEGATVRIPTPIVGDDSRETTTNAQGEYTFELQGSGSFNVIAQATDFVRVRQTVNVPQAPATAGTFEANVRKDFELHATGQALQGQLLLSSGTPLEGVEITADVDSDCDESGSSIPGTILDSDLSTTATTDADGNFALDNLPANVAVELLIPAHDMDGDGTPDTEAATPCLQVQFGTNDAGSIVVDDLASADARILTSNVGDPDEDFSCLSGGLSDPNPLFAADGTIEIVFTVPLDTRAGERDITLRNMSQNNDVFATTSFSRMDTQLNVDPDQSLTPGDSYRLLAEVSSADGNTQFAPCLRFTVASGVESIDAPQNLSITQVMDLQQTGPPMPDSEGTVGHNTDSVALEWDEVPGADSYRVYVKRTGGDGPISDWIQVLNPATNMDTLNIETFVDEGLDDPAILDDFGVNDPLRAFDAGESYDVAVTAVQSGGESGLSNTVTIADQECVDLERAEATGVAADWNNSSGSPNDVAIEVEFSELISMSTLPSVDFDDTSSLDSEESSFSLVFSQPPASFEFHGGAMTSEIQGQVPDSSNGSGVDFTVVATSVEDPSGNGACDDPEEQTGTTP